MVAIKYTPSWKPYEKKMREGSPQEQRQAAELFDKERSHQLRVDPQARKWETERKATLAKDKPQWVEDRIKKEQQAKEEPFKVLKKAGSYSHSLAPCPGYLLVKPDDNDQTPSGIVLAAEEPPNTGLVLAIGGELVLNQNNKTIQPPAKVGDHILYRKGAGLEITIKDEPQLLMMFTDILGCFHE